MLLRPIYCNNTDQ